MLETCPDSRSERNMNAEFPADGFPHIGYNHIWKYLIEDVEFKKQLSVKKIYRKSASIVQQI